MNLRLLPLLCLPFAALAQEAGERSAYTCDNGSRIEISFSSASDGQPLAVLHFADEAITLPQVAAPSGALYRNATIRLHIEHEQAIFEDEQSNIRRCTLGNGPAQSTPASSAPVTPAAASSFIEISGQISYRQLTELPADAVLIVRVQDVSRRAAPARQLAEQRLTVAGQPQPIAFATSIDRDLVGKKARITVSARIEQGGKPLFVSNKTYPALKHGQDGHPNILLQPVGRARAR